MILATVHVEDFDRFLGVFSTQGLERRKQHGSKGATVFRDPEDSDRVWVAFDWDEESYQRFMADPDMAAVFQQAGLKGRPQSAEPAGRYDA